MVDPARFPSLHAYLRALPAGLDSYPECQSKATLARSALEGHDADALAADLPKAMGDVIRHVQPVGIWMPAVHADAVFHAVCDRYYPSDAKMLAWCKARTVAMASNPIYSALLRVSGPRICFAMGARSHRLFQRGTELEIESLGSRRVVIALRFPAHLHSRLNLLSNVALLEAIGEITGGRFVEGKMLVQRPEYARYTCTWH